MNWTRSLGVLAILAMPAMGDDWTHLGRDDARTRLPAEVIVSPAPLDAGVSTGSPTVASPVAADGFIVVAGLDGAVRAYRESDRAPLWTRNLGMALISTPVVDRGRIYAPSTSGTLSILRLSDGVVLGSITTGGADQSSPVLSGGRLFLASGFPNMSAKAIDVATRNEAWSAPMEQVSTSSPALASGLVVVGCDSGRYYALDAATGAAQWDFPTDGVVGPSSPLIDGTTAYLISGAGFYSVDLEHSNWSANWSLEVGDPVPAPAGIVGVDFAASSPAKAGDVLVFVLRFNYYLDTDGDGWTDSLLLREYAVAVDPDPRKRAIRWQVLLAEQSGLDMNGMPPYRLCPTPVSTGAGAVFASSIGSSLNILSLVDGSPLSSFALDAPCLASPIVANARIYALSTQGTLYAFQGGHAPPGAATGLTPSSSVDLSATPGQLSWNASSPGATYHVRLTRGNDFLADWDFDAVVSDSFVACPPLSDNSICTWGVRVRDSLGACGPWSLASFDVNVPPDPPSGLSAVGKHQKVILSWTASASSNVVGYRLAYGPTGQPPASMLSLGTVATATVTGLTNGVSYTFELRALNSIGLLSTPVTATATPVSLIWIGSKSYDTLQAAGSAAKSGQTIQLGEDTFTLTSTMGLTSGVTLRGVNAHVTRILATGAFDMIKAGKDSAVRLVTLAGGSVGVHVPNAGVFIQNCVVRDMSDTGIAVSGGATVVNNTIVRNINAALRVTGGGKASARNNIVEGNGYGFLGKVSSTYNDLVDPSGVPFGTGDISATVIFLDPTSGDFREAPSQPSIDRGDLQDAYSLEPYPNGNRINMGAFGNTSLATTSP